MRTNIVMIDFESVQPESLSSLAPEHFRIFVFVGASQAKLPFDVAASLQRFGSRAEYIKISGNGPNALDFHIAYYIGQLSATDPTAYFHIVSRDTGFTPLVHHLKSKGVFAGRVNSVADIPMVKAATAKSPIVKAATAKSPTVKAATAKSPTERLHVAVTFLKEPKTPKPRTVNTLRNSLDALFRKQLSPEETTAIIDALAEHRHISVVGTKVIYAVQNGAEKEIRNQ